MMRLIVTFVVLAACYAEAQTCPITAWCNVTNQSVNPSVVLGDNDWNKLVFSADTGKYYLYADRGTITT